jgi:hypothetical protein
MKFYCFFEIICSFGWKLMQEFQVSFHFKPVVDYITVLEHQWSVPFGLL